MKLLKQNQTFKGVIYREPELRFAPNGKAVTTFSLLIDETPIMCEAWEDLAERIVETNLEAGAEVEVTGSMRIRKYSTMDEQEKEYEYISVTAIGL